MNRRTMIWRNLFFAIALMLSWIPAGASADAGDQAKRVFRAGAYAQNVNPKKYPVSVNGGMRDRLAHGAHDPLHARCLVLDDGKTRLAFAVVDSCMIPREITDEAKRIVEKEIGIPPHCVLISATHTHTAPTVTGVFQSEPNKEYVALLPKLIARGIIQAYRQREPARIGWGVGKNAEQVFNRRWYRKQALIPRDPFGRATDLVQMNPGYQAKGLIKPAGPIDPDVSILAVESTGGRPIAVLANYSLHYVGGVQPLSADYFAAFAESLARKLGAEKTKPAFVGIMSNGTSGDINNINYGGPSPGRRRPYEQIRIVAESVAKTAHEAYKRIRFRKWVALDAAQEEITLGVRLPSAADVERAKQILAKAKGPVLKTREQIYARETVLLAKYPPKVKVILQAMRIGDLAICAIPCEVFAEIGLELKKKSPFLHTFTIELANGYNGYLPTPRQHKLGGYETWRARSSYLEVDASPKIVRTLLGLLARLHKETARDDGDSTRR